MSKRRRSRSKQAIAGQEADGARRTRVLYGCLLLVAGCLAYANSFDGAFVFDDGLNIVKDKSIRHLWPPGHWLGTRRPVVSLSLAINYKLGELEEPWGYHLFNLSVHLIAGLTLFALIGRVLSLDRFGSVVRRSRYPFAAAVALLWLVHPLQTQSVTYIIQRAEALMGMFYMLCLYTLHRGAHSRVSWRWHAACVCSCALGMASKAVMVTAPPMLLLYDRVFLAGSWRELVRRRWALHLGAAATWSFLVFSGITRGVLNPPPTAQASVGFGVEEFSAFEYALTQPGVILHYLRLAVWPRGQCLDYGWPVVDDPGDAVVPAVVVVLLILATLWALWRRSWLGFAGAWFFGVLAPTSSFIPIKDAAFEHRMYLPLAAVVIVVLAAGRSGLIFLFDRMRLRPARRHLIFWALVIAVALALSSATHVRNALYHDPVLVWQDVIAKAPRNPRAHNSLAWAYLERDDNAAAILKFQDAIRVDPEFASAYANLCAVQLEEGAYAGAVASCLKALELDPQGFGAEVPQKLAAAYMLQGNVAAATRAFREAIRVDPDGCKEDVYLNYGSALMMEGRLDEAIAAFETAARMKPDYEMAYYNRGNALSQKGDFQAAIESYRRALRLKPDYAEANVRLGVTLRKTGRSEESLDCFRKALDSISMETSAWVPIEVHHETGNTLLDLGKKAEAAAAFRAALRIDPNHPGARKGLRSADAS